MGWPGGWGGGPVSPCRIVPGSLLSSLGPNQDTTKARPRNSSHGGATIAGHRVTRLRRSVNSLLLGGASPGVNPLFQKFQKSVTRQEAENVDGCI